MSRAGLFAIGLLTFASCAAAQEINPAQRKALVPIIVATSDCVARQMVADPRALSAYRAGTFTEYVRRNAREVCPREVATLISQGNLIAWYGYGDAFYNGAYLADLPRAVLTRIRAQLDIAAEEASKREVERDRLGTIAQRKREEERKVEEERRKRNLENSEKAFDLLRDALYACTAREIVSMLSSGETAEVLATASLTMCNKEYEQALLGSRQLAEARIGGRISDQEDDVLRAESDAVIKKTVTTSAVKLKAMGADRRSE
jgi:hypothetical protein